MYEQYVESFQIGVAALDSDLPKMAEENLTKAIDLVPQEPAGWANRGLLYLRSSQLEEAARDLEQASRLAPLDAEVQKLLGLLKQRRGQFEEAAAHLRTALESDRDDIKALYLLARIVKQGQQEGSDDEYDRLLDQILAVRPQNLFVLIDRLSLAVRRNDAESVRGTLQRFEKLAPSWREQTRTALADLNSLDSLGPDAIRPMLVFSNLLRAERTFTRDAAEVDPRDELAGEALQSFRWLAPASHSPAPPDSQLTFVRAGNATFPEGSWEAVLPVWPSAEGPMTVLFANSQEIRELGHDFTLAALPASREGFISFDANNDLRVDLLQAGSQGLRFYAQQADGKFLDATATLNLTNEVIQAAYHSANAVDFDLDGDLDLLLSLVAGPPRWLRNNSDGTFSSQLAFATLHGPLSFTWADFNHDGAPDAALLDSQGLLHVFSNERSGEFRAWASEIPAERFLALNSADVNDDGVIDVLVLREDGSIVAISDRDQQALWEVSELAQWDSSAGANTLLAADLDNNGVVDLLASGPQSSAIWLGGGDNSYSRLPADLPPRIMAVADARSVGRLDLFGIDSQGRPFQLQNTGRESYHWQTIRPQAATGRVEGDNRINSFGIGGEIEIRSGTHVVTQPIRSPVVHFGLGRRTQSDVVRIVWPNGVAQYEFKPAIDQSVVAVQRLKGSCPFLFAWNGRAFEFVTDFMWSTPLGMYINASNKGGFLQTTDWVRVAGDQLVARDGNYELRVNANLWETHFFDHLALVVVDHPIETEMFVDERFCLEPTEPALRLTSSPMPVASARDHQGRNATEEIRAIDGVYLDRAGRGLYQGITSDHWVEVDLGEEALSEGPMWLVARGWIHPTDSSINFALEQGRHVKPQALVLELPDGQGGWKVGRDRIGFPAGKNKTILLRLDGLDEGRTPRRFRLRTNMEIYWDALHIARGADDTLARRQVLLPDSAELRFRGVLAMSQANASSPELPRYDEVISLGQPWRDLVGYHTRFGEIAELLALVDDRYAIVSAGDEVALRFVAPADPPVGWRRDFVWVSDGWVKDGDLNTRFGKTVLPLPAHDMQSYNTPPQELQDDPVFQRHSQDWETYHTRQITPNRFERGLRNFRSPALRQPPIKP